MKERPDGTVKTFVRRIGRMSGRNQTAHGELAHRYLVSPEPENRIDPRTTLPGYGRYVLEIGFGMGHALIELAAARPDTGFWGIDVHKPGVARVMLECRDKGLDNVRVMENDALDVCRDTFTAGVFDGIHVFFPDPWPKKRHRKRRLISDANLPVILGTLKTGGYLYCVTDWKEYAEEMLAVTDRCPLLINESGGFCPPVPWRPKTRFEQKGLEKEHPINELYLIKK